VIKNVSLNTVIHIRSSKAKLLGVRTFRYGVWRGGKWLWIDSNNKNGN